MSLINQVLNDLEKRGASANIGEATIRVVPIRQQHGMFWPFVAAVSVSVLAASAWLKWGADAKIKVPPVALATVPAAIVMQPVSQAAATATAKVPPALTAPVSSLKDTLNTATKAATLADKPLLQLAPVVSAVNPSPAISQSTPLLVTITGSNFASDATVTLHTPEGKVYAKRKIMMQNAHKIVISANFGNVAGPWRVEVVNASAHLPGQLASGEFTFSVQAAAAVVSAQAQNKTALPATISTRNVAKTGTEVILTSGISKQTAQITPQQQAESEFRKAYALMQQGQVNAAISGYETALQLDAGHLVARQTLARLLLEHNRNKDAERVLQEGLQHDPKQYSLAMLLARMQVGHNELSQALDTMQKSLPYAQQQADYQAFVAALLQRQGRHKEAIEYFQNAVQLSPQSGVWLMGLGISLHAEQRNADAREAFNRALGSHNLSAELQSYVTQQLKEL
jgi:MSHA biogenesis protein MshN